MQPYYYLHSLLFRLVNLSCLIANYECISYYIAWCYGYFFCSTGYFSVMLTSFVGSEIEATVSLRMVCAFFFLFFLIMNDTISTQINSNPYQTDYIITIMPIQPISKCYQYFLLALQKILEKAREVEDTSEKKYKHLKNNLKEV